MHDAHFLGSSTRTFPRWLLGFRDLHEHVLRARLHSWRAAGGVGRSQLIDLFDWDFYLRPTKEQWDPRGSYFSSLSVPTVSLARPN